MLELIGYTPRSINARVYHPLYEVLPSRGCDSATGRYITWPALTDPAGNRGLLTSLFSFPKGDMEERGERVTDKLKPNPDCNIRE
jgi:hypothetical protein